MYTATDDLPLVLTASDVQKVVPLSRAGVYDLMNSEGFPTLRLGKRLVVPKDAFLKWLGDNTGKIVNMKTE